MQEVEFGKGEMIFAEGDPGTLCYRIVSGKVDILLNVPGMMNRGRAETVSSCGPGEIIGAMSVISRGPRSASAVAAKRTICVAMEPDEITKILENDPLEALAYIRTLIRHQRQSNRTIAWSSGQRR